MTNHILDSTPPTLHAPATPPSPLPHSTFAIFSHPSLPIPLPNTAYPQEWPPTLIYAFNDDATAIHPTHAKHFAEAMIPRSAHHPLTFAATLAPLPLNTDRLFHIAQLLSRVAAHPSFLFLVSRLGLTRHANRDRTFGPLFANAPANLILPFEWRAYRHTDGNYVRHRIVSNPMTLSGQHHVFSFTKLYKGIASPPEYDVQLLKAEAEPEGKS